MKLIGEKQKTTAQQQYDEMYIRVHKAIEWLDHPSRTNKEVEKWLPIYEGMYDEMMRLKGMASCEKPR